VALKITSNSFAYGQPIPSKYTCDGQNINPPLSISGVPAGTKSLVLIMEDPDIPDFVKDKFGIDLWDHWIVWNIPVETKDILEGTSPEGVHGRNTRGNNAYGGPCPPDGTHRYFFYLYALDTQLSLKEGAAKSDVLKVMNGHVLAKAEHMGVYQRI